MDPGSRVRPLGALDCEVSRLDIFRWVVTVIGAFLRVFLPYRSLSGPRRRIHYYVVGEIGSHFGSFGRGSTAVLGACVGMLLYIDMEKGRGLFGSEVGAGHS